MDDIDTDLSETHGHEFDLFRFTWLNYSKEIHLFRVVGWDKGEAHGASLLGFTLTSDFLEFSFCFMNFTSLLGEQE